MSAFYIAAGVNHFLHPEVYRKIMPLCIKWHDELIMISGAGEILFALLLLFPATRRMGAYGIIVLLIAVFPANIQMTLNLFHEHSPRLWLSILRLPFQIVLIWWAYRFTKPFVLKTIEQRNSEAIKTDLNKKL